MAHCRRQMSPCNKMFLTKGESFFPYSSGSEKKMLYFSLENIDNFRRIKQYQVTNKKKSIRQRTTGQGLIRRTPVSAKFRGLSSKKRVNIRKFVRKTLVICISGAYLLVSVYYQPWASSITWYFRYAVRSSKISGFFTLRFCLSVRCGSVHGRILAL